MFTDAYKYREVENGIFYEVEGRVIVRIFLSFLFKMNAQMLHTHMTFYGFCTRFGTKSLVCFLSRDWNFGSLMCNQEHIFAFWGRFPIPKRPTPPLTPQSTLDACIPEFFPNYKVLEDALFYEGTQKLKKIMNALLSWGRG